MPLIVYATKEPTCPVCHQAVHVWTLGDPCPKHEACSLWEFSKHLHETFDSFRKKHGLPERKFTEPVPYDKAYQENTWPLSNAGRCEEARHRHPSR